MRCVSDPLATITTSATASAPGTAQRGARRLSSSQATMTGAIAAGLATTAVNGAMHSVSSTPASIALANAGGIFPTSSPSGRMSPQAASSRPEGRRR